MLAENNGMKRQAALQVLRSLEPVLRQQFAVKSLELFGSVARDDATEASDVDLLVEFDRPIGLLHLIGTEQFLQRKLGVSKVDLLIRHSVVEDLRADIFREAIDVFQGPEMEVPRPSHAAEDAACPNDGSHVVSCCHFFFPPPVSSLKTNSMFSARVLTSTPVHSLKDGISICCLISSSVRPLSMSRCTASRSSTK